MAKCLERHFCLVFSKLTKPTVSKLSQAISVEAFHVFLVVAIFNTRIGGFMRGLFDILFEQDCSIMPSES